MKRSPFVKRYLPPVRTLQRIPVVSTEAIHYQDTSQQQKRETNKLKS